MSRSDCDTIRPLISAALDGDLDEDEFVQLSEHLSSCAQCRQVHQDYSRLRDGLRSSSPPAPPPQLARDVWKETVEKPPPPAIIRLASRTGVRFGMSTMAASVVALLAAVLFLAHGYDQRTIPTVAGSQPEQGAIGDWPINQPVEIEFRKQMNRDSVEDNLIIWPGSEQERLPTSWSGNTLIIGRSEDHSALLHPETDYRITILEHAEDRHGNPLGDFWILTFRTGQPEVAISTPSPGSDQSVENDEAGDIAGNDWQFGQGATQDSETPTPEPENEASPTGDEVQPETGESRESQQQESSLGNGSTDQQQESLQQNGPSDQVQPSEPETDPTAEPEPEPTQPQPTPRPQSTATPEPDPEPTVEPSPTTPPAPSPTPEEYAVRGPFGEVYWGNSSVQDALGAPTQSAHYFIAAEQEFQRGLMFRQYYQDRNSIFVFINGGQVRTFHNEFDPDQHDFPVEDKGDGLYQPGGYFGKVWSEHSSIADGIGYSVSSGPSENVDAAIQQFNRGTLLYSSGGASDHGSVYVIYSDGSWDVYSVRSGSNGGFQNEDPDRETDQSDDSESTEPDSESPDAEHQEPDTQPTPEPEAETDDHQPDDSAGAGDDET